MAAVIPLALLAILALVLHAGAARIPEGPDKCCRKYLDGIESCCRTPEIVPEPSMSDCAAVGPDGGSPDKSADKSADLTPGEGDLLTAPDVIGSPCTTDCFFNNHKFYTPEGQIDSRAVIAAFSANVSGSWRNILDLAVTDCTSAVSGMNASSGAAAASCNPRAEAFMICLSRGLVTNCPADSSNKTAEGCSGKLEGLKTCDPAVSAGAEEADDPEDDDLPTYMQKEKTLAKGGFVKGGKNLPSVQQKKVLPLNPKNLKSSGSATTKKPKPPKKRTTAAPVAKNVVSGQQTDKKKNVDNKKKVAVEIPKSVQG